MSYQTQTKGYPSPPPPPRAYPAYDAQPAPKAEMSLRPPPPPREIPPTYHASRNGEAHWHSGLLACCSAVDICCLACLCPCLQYSRNKHRLLTLSTTGQPARQSGSGADADCALHGLLTLLGCWGWVLQRPVRQGIRDRYNIPGTPASDCLSSFLCSPCALTQESRELGMEERRLRTAALQGVAGIYGMDDSAAEDPIGCGEVCCCCVGTVGQAGGRAACWW
ncbi:PLAC8-domain-containing protein [Calocera viscosa TUFC12733]|uniref:PLAC8-domain-containing protein n=1 Tax=Calocera viscosa (strain TUFC12733) TaxID=1330018 RepID=A0A167PBE6_CALVF|nr:PLAC8-domain-containing protein [Calocera viscosa TUFC12733]